MAIFLGFRPLPTSKISDSRPDLYAVTLTTFLGVLFTAIFDKRKRMRYAATRSDILCHFSRHLWKSIFWHWSFTKRSQVNYNNKTSWVTQQEPLNLERYFIFRIRDCVQDQIENLHFSFSSWAHNLDFYFPLPLSRFPNTTVPLWQHVGPATQTEPREFGCIRWGQFG